MLVHFVILMCKHYAVLSFQNILPSHVDNMNMLSKSTHSHRWAAVFAAGTRSSCTEYNNDHNSANLEHR